MGNKTNANVNGKLYNPEEYVVLQEINSERYGKSTLLMNKQTQMKYIESNKTLIDEKQFKQLIEKLSFIKTLNHENLLKLVNYNSINNSQMCSTFYKIGQLYEYANNDLRTELSERKQVKFSYSEGELFYLLVSLVKALLYLREFKQSHEQIKPSNILINDEGKVKLTQCNQHILFDEYYMSQEKLACLKSNQLYNKEKNDIFAIGLIVLESGLLEDVTGLYDFTNLKINFVELNKKLALFQSKYSNQLYDLVSKMLIEKEVERVSLDQLALEIESVSKLSFGRLLTIELAKAQTQVTEQKLEEKNVVVEAEQSKEVYSYSIYTTEKITNYNDDLMARVQAAIKASQQTIEQYGAKENTATYYTTTYVSNQQSAVTGYSPMSFSTSPVQAKAY